MFKDFFQGLAADFIKDHFNKALLLIPGGITATVIGYVQSNYWMFLTILLSCIVFYLIYLIKDYRTTGITAVYEPQKLSTAKALDKTESSFYFLGVSAKSTSDDKAIEAQFQKLVKKNAGYEIKFLLMNPLAIENIRVRASHENADPDAWPLHMKSSILSLNSIANRLGIKIQIRLYDDYPLWRMVIIDRKRVFLNYALQGQKINSSPLIKMKNNDNAICNTFIQNFELLWEKTTTVTLEKWLQSNTLN